MQRDQTRPDALSIPATTSSLQTNLKVFSAQLEAKLKINPASDTMVTALVSVPRGKPLEWIVWYFSQTVKNTPYQIKDCIYNKKADNCRMIFTSPDPSNKKTVLTIAFSGRFLSSAAKMAILVDLTDTAISRAEFQEFIIFPEALTLALWPHDTLSKERGRQADDFQKEVVILLPLESAIKIPSYYAAQLIMIHFSESKIRDAVNGPTRAIPSFAGLGNLFGSRALEDSRVMRIILEEAKERHAYFIETKTTRKSVVAAVAGSVGLPFAVVQNRIVEKEQIGLIENELQRSMVAAYNGGKFIISVKATRAVLTALNNELPHFKQNGIKLVFVSELVNHPEEK